jgi:hypothetical protein
MNPAFIQRSADKKINVKDAHDGLCGGVGS